MMNSRHINPRGMQKPEAGNTPSKQIHTDISHDHTDISNVHTDISFVHTDISFVHTDISSVHTDISSVHTDISFVHTDLLENSLVFLKWNVLSTIDGIHSTNSLTNTINNI